MFVRQKSHSLRQKTTHSDTASTPSRLPSSVSALCRFLSSHQKQTIDMARDPLPVRSVLAPGTFASRVLLITGGATGIGLRTACEAVQLGGHVIIASRKVAVLEAAEAFIHARYPPLVSESSAPRVVALPCNIREPASIAALIAAIHKLPASFFFGTAPRVDILVNNAGGQFPSPAEDISPKGWHAVIETNLTGTFQLSQAIFRAFFAGTGVPCTFCCG